MGTNELKTLEEIIAEANVRDIQNEDDHEALSDRIYANTEAIIRLGGGTQASSGTGASSSLTGVNGDGEVYSEYNYQPDTVRYFDSKINVCKWFTRKMFNKFTGDKYPISIRKNGVMAYPRYITALACEQAFNYKLFDGALRFETQKSITVNNADGTSRSITLQTHNSTLFKREESYDHLEWYLSNPYGIPGDFYETYQLHALFCEQESSEEARKAHPKIAANCIACFNPSISLPHVFNKRVIVHVLGADAQFTVDTVRTGMPLEFVRDLTSYSVANIKAHAEYWAERGYNNYVTWAADRTQEFPAVNGNFLYISVSEVDSLGNATTVYEKWADPNMVNSRFHYVTTAAPLILAKYILQCSEDEIVEYKYSTMKSYELSRPFLPVGYNNYIIGINNYGTNSELVDETTSLEDAWFAACISDNTYAIYALFLHLYKGLTDTAKDTISPMFETVCSWDDGYVLISFPEASAGEAEVAGGENSVSYSQKQFTTTTDAWYRKVSNTYYNVNSMANLTDNSVVFNKFENLNNFTVTLEFPAPKWENLPSVENPTKEYITGTEEILIGTIADVEFYICGCSKNIYPLLSTTGNPYMTSTLSNCAIKIVDGKSLIYMGIRYWPDQGNKQWNVVVTISYENGFWDICGIHEQGGVN